jgi:hypothetical protein
MQPDGGLVLPGFSVPVSQLFEVPKRPAARCGQKKKDPQSGKNKRRPPGR